MKKIIIAVILIGASFTSFAQEQSKNNNGDENTGGFKKQNLFVGGGLDFSLSTYGTVLGIEPEFGYSFNKWLDAGIVLNFIYSSSRESDIYGDLTGNKFRQTDFGPGAFVRLYPVDFLFVQGQYENNFIRYKEVYSYGTSSPTYSTSAPSLLLGAGYCTGREGGSGTPFFYLSISADVIANKYSPYVAIDGGGNAVILPIIRGGLQIPLFQNGGGSSSHRRHHRDEDY